MGAGNIPRLNDGACRGRWEEAGNGDIEVLDESGDQ